MCLADPLEVMTVYCKGDRPGEAAWVFASASRPLDTSDGSAPFQSQCRFLDKIDKLLESWRGIAVKADNTPPEPETRHAG